MGNATFSLWEKESYLGPRDVVIVGGGLVGLWSAWFLLQARPSLRITLLERGLLPSGASTRNAGFACFGSPGEIVRDIRTMGRDRALELVDLRFRGLERLKRLLPPSVTGYEETGGYECFLRGQDYEDVREALDGLNRDLRDITGHYPVFVLADGDLGGLGLRGFDHLIGNPLEGALHSGRLLQALTRTVQSLGATCLTGVSVRAWEEGPGGVEVHTDQGFSVHCGGLLVCTNGFARQLLGEVDVAPARGQVLVTEPIPGLSLSGTFHYDQGFYYFRNLGDRVLLGGARNQAFTEEATVAMGTTAPIQEALEAFLHRHIPQAVGVPVSDRWAGIMGMGSEKRPLLQQVSGHVFCAVRLSGMGVAISSLVGEQAADLVLGGIF